MSQELKFTINEIKKLSELFRLKEIKRRSSVGNRAESSAEHSWSCILLAEYFLPKIKQKLDENKVIKMLLYHDLIEIKSGDTYFFDEAATRNQKKLEYSALENLRKSIPTPIFREFIKYWKEFDENTTPEAKFCQAIDKLDPIIQAAFNKKEWKQNKITEKQLREKKQHYFTPFPEINQIFEEFISYAKQNKYF
ncbi:MAG: HD domain-containing protein [Candidatus Woesearchaeota archaeon]